MCHLGVLHMRVLSRSKSSREEFSLITSIMFSLIILDSNSILCAYYVQLLSSLLVPIL